jgi:hypothetical protein
MSLILNVICSSHKYVFLYDPAFNHSILLSTHKSIANLNLHPTDRSMFPLHPCPAQMPP